MFLLYDGFDVIMSNLKHYLEKIRKGDIYFDEAFKISILLRETGILHLVFSVLFFIMGNIHLGVYDVIIFIIYNLLVVLVKKKKFKLLILLTAVEVVIHGLICTATLGIGTGFTLYYFTMILGLFYTVYAWDVFKKKERTVIIYTIAALFAMLASYLISVFCNPIIPIPEIWSHIFNVSNIVLSMAALLEFLILLGWDILSKNENLSSKNDELDKMANMDPLTKLYNRRYIDGVLAAKYEELHQTGDIFGIIIADIDDFKKVNDTYGHDAGDEVLVRVAEILKKSVRDNDYVCRWGGEEFLVIIAGNKQITSDVAERMRKSIMKEVIKLDEADISITMTFGVTESTPGYTVEKLINIADENLYKGKNNGKNQVVI